MRHILLTGGTGVIGSALVPRLLADPRVRLSLIVRARSDEQLEQRRRSLLEFCQVSDPEQLSRVEFLRGDVCEDQLGLRSGEYEDLAASVTGVIHAAGNVKLNQSLSDARRNACGATETILAFAQGKARRLQKVDVVSTIGVAGRMPGVIPERRLVEPHDFHNNYEQAKAEAEELLWQAMDDGLPITIHRPSMVVGDSRTGRIIEFQVFYYLCEFLSGRRSFGFLPQFGSARLDTIPVDFVAESIQRISRMPETQGRAIHLCSGADKSASLRSIVEAMRQYHQARGVRLPPPRYLPRAIFGAGIRVLASILPRKQRRGLQTLPHFLTYLCEDQVFGVRDTSELLGSLGLTIPVFYDYIDAVLRYRSNATSRYSENRVVEPIAAAHLALSTSS